jgi:ribonuclease HI
MDSVVIYTDGACRGNPGPGGWGAILTCGERTKEIKGYAENTTNNKMELMAAIEALSTLKSDDRPVILYTDSVYVKNGITTWMTGWKQRNWKTASKQPVKNQELWQRLDALNQKLTIDWRWVKGHAGIEGNEKADQLANQAIDEAK